MTVGPTVQCWAIIHDGKVVVRGVLFDEVGRPVHHVEATNFPAAQQQLIGVGVARMGESDQATADITAQTWLNELEDARAAARARR